MADIRPVTPEDMDTVVVLELEVFASRAWSPRSVEEEFAGLGDTRAMWLAEVDDEGRTKAVGYAVGRYVGDVADLQRVAVLPSRRRLGIGRDLVRQVVAAARDHGCDRVLLEVAADNTAAITLYEVDGFRAIDRRPRYYGGEVDAVIMQRDLDEGKPSDG